MSCLPAIIRTLDDIRKVPRAPGTGHSDQGTGHSEPAPDTLFYYPHMAIDPLELVSRQVIQITALTALAEADLMNGIPGVSGWSVSEHLDHTLKVLASILRGMMHPDKPPTRPFSFIGKVILLTGYIPRGRGKSPATLRGERATVEQLLQRIGEVETLLTEMRAGTRPHASALLVRHPLFGGMTWAQSARFAGVHTNHHLKIVNEILRRRPVASGAGQSA